MNKKLINEYNIVKKEKKGNDNYDEIDRNENND